VYHNFAAGSFLSKKFCSRLYSIEVDFYCKKGKVRFLSHPLGDLEVTYALHLQVVGATGVSHMHSWHQSRRAIIELLSLALTVETLQAEICRHNFWSGVCHFERPFYVEGDVAHEPLLGSRKQELIRRWDSERELFYKIAHVEASAYAHWTSS